MTKKLVIIIPHLAAEAAPVLGGRAVRKVLGFQSSTCTLSVHVKLARSGHV
jgi:hypothetical protein